MRVGILTNLVGLLFPVRLHGTMRCCGREIFRRLYYILYRKVSLVLYMEVLSSVLGGGGYGNVSISETLCISNCWESSEGDW